MSAGAAVGGSFCIALPSSSRTVAVLGLNFTGDAAEGTEAWSVAAKATVSRVGTRRRMKKIISSPGFSERTENHLSPFGVVPAGSGPVC